MRELLSPHVFIGMVLIPPVLVKVASTTWRFARYYAGAPAYRRKGSPPVLLRPLGPVVVILTLVLLFSGVGLLLVSRPWLPLLLKVHKISFVLWFGSITGDIQASSSGPGRAGPRAPPAARVPRVHVLLRGPAEAGQPRVLRRRRPASIQAQLAGAARRSPVHALISPLTHVALPLGILIALGELAVGVDTLLGPRARLAAAGASCCP